MGGSGEYHAKWNWPDSGSQVLKFLPYVEAKTNKGEELKEIKGIQIGIEIGKELKLSLFADDMITYLEDPKISTKTF